MVALISSSPEELLSTSLFARSPSLLTGTSSTGSSFYSEIFSTSYSFCSSSYFSSSSPWVQLLILKLRMIYSFAFLQSSHRWGGNSSSFGSSGIGSGGFDFFFFLCRLSSKTNGSPCFFLYASCSAISRSTIGYSAGCTLYIFACLAASNASLANRSFSSFFYNFSRSFLFFSSLSFSNFSWMIGCKFWISSSRATVACRFFACSRYYLSSSALFFYSRSFRIVSAMIGCTFCSSSSWTTVLRLYLSSVDLELLFCSSSILTFIASAKAACDAPPYSAPIFHKSWLLNKN